MASYLKSGKQIFRLLLSPAAARRSQQLFSPKLSSLYLASNRCLGVANFSTNESSFTKLQNPSALQRFLTFFKIKPSPYRTMRDLLSKAIHMVEEHQLHPEENLSAKLEPILIEVLDTVTDEDVAKLLDAYARRASSSASANRLDKALQDLADILSDDLTEPLQDLLINMFTAKYESILDEGPHFSLILAHDGLHVNVDVSHLAKEHLKVFIIDTWLIITGSDTKADAAIGAQVVKQIITFPESPYVHNKVTGSIVDGGKLNIYFPFHLGDNKEVKNPRFFQVSLI